MGKKIRLIDANALKGALDRAATAQPRPPYPNAAMSCIDKAPTIDAIPVAWLEDKLNATAVTNPDLNNAVFYVLVVWEQQKQNNEQEAR